MKLSHIMLAATMLLATTTAHAQSITGAGALLFWFSFIQPSIGESRKYIKG
ncbi:hypothetical protein UFOVP29_375 [uncultured Caudovirales phage]|uniref:Uncharacterized protein n=1 Tax=uncultured Caudovirales phage TaxID=2100421 RepID=A0A6J5KPN8_9CAUD|nr:hypothetical protein UFOVP29_375 [uncultured Caudovirales phage]